MLKEEEKKEQLDQVQLKEEEEVKEKEELEEELDEQLVMKKEAMTKLPGAWPPAPALLFKPL